MEGGDGYVIAACLKARLRATRPPSAFSSFLLFHFSH